MFPRKRFARGNPLFVPRRSWKTIVSRKMACVGLLLFVAWVATVSATRFAAPASAAQAAAQKQPVAEDPEDPRFAGHFRGRVSGPDGKPLAGAQVRIVPVYGKSKEARVRVTTDADGRYAFDAPDMTYTELDGLPARREGLVIVSKEGHAPDWFHTWGHRTGLGFRTHWDPVKGDQVQMRLARDDVAIHGRLLDADGQPLAAARVRVRGLMIPRQYDLDAHLEREKKRSLVMASDNQQEIDPSRLPGLTTETRTDAAGRFTLSGLGRDRLAVLEVSAPSVVTASLTVMTRDGPDVPVVRDFNGNFAHVVYGAGFTLRLSRGMTVHGQVRDRETKAPLAGMWVAWRHDPRGNSPASVEPAVTDAQGRFTLNGLIPDLWTWDKDHRAVAAFSRPGGLYLPAETLMEPGKEIIIECVRGIPFRIKVVDEQGQPAEGEVEYQYLSPNPQVEKKLTTFPGNHSWPLANRAARTAAGTYEGYVLPGPGAVLVRTPGRNYRPAYVNPRAFFEPGRTNWTAQERISSYGTNNSLQIGPEWTDQHDYAAIVLVNPAPKAPRLELSATVYDDRPRRVSLIDPAGKPVVGVQSHGVRWYPWGQEPLLRAASFPLTRLHPDRPRRITFVKEERGLIGFLLARGDGVAPYTVRMQPWGTVTGRLVDPAGKPLKDVSFYLGGFGLETNPDPLGGEFAHIEMEKDGRFRVDHLIPGQRYTAETYRQPSQFLGMAFENLVLRPGEVRDFGDLRPRPPMSGKQADE
jgi:protocatechuate 3,4-dioxygenase beta subunit